MSVEQLSEGAKHVATEGVPLLVHAELMSEEEIKSLNEVAAQGDRQDFMNFLQTRPPEFEQRAIRALLEVLKSTPQLRAHIVHLSDATVSLDLIKAAKADFGKGRLTVESCPHYLVFAAETIPRGDTRLKCLPPIRNSTNRDLLWEALREGAIDLLSSDHSPCTTSLRKLEEGDFMAAWAGISGVQLSLAATWHEARRRGHSVLELSRWWSENPAKLAGLWAVKGSLEIGKDADYVAWDPEEVINAWCCVI